MEQEFRREVKGSWERVSEAYERDYGQRGSSSGGGSAGAPVRVQSADDYNRLPSGAMYIAPDGTQRRKR